MKKSNKKKLIVFWMICAGVGFIIGHLIGFLEDKVQMHSIVSSVKAGMPYLFVISSISGVIGLLGYFYFKRQLEKDNYSNEEGSFYEKNEKIMGLTLMCSTLTAVINFTAFGVNLTSFSILTALFLINVVLSLAGETGHIQLIRKVRPELNADPMDPGFNREYFDKLDECEKIKVGKASMKTMTAMTFVFVSLFLICYMITVILNISPVICLPIGIIWGVQTVLYTFYSNKESK